MSPADWEFIGLRHHCRALPDPRQYEQGTLIRCPECGATWERGVIARSLAGIDGLLEVYWVEVGKLTMKQVLELVQEGA